MIDPTPVLICLNGASGVGKDTAAELILDMCPPKYQMNHDKFAAPLEACVKALFEDTEAGIDFYAKRHHPVHKEDPVYKNLSSRDLMIGLSEVALKPWLGHKIFGELAAMRWQCKCWEHQQAISMIYSDCGFQLEYDIFCDTAMEYDPKARIYLINILREGHTFEGDSRHIVESNWMTKGGINIHNDGTMEELKDKLAIALADVF